MRPHHLGQKRTMVVREWTSPTIVAVVAFVLVHGVAGCDHDVPGPPPATPVVRSPGNVPPPRPPTPVSHGYFTGWTWIGDARYLTESLLTADGAMRLHARGPYVSDGIGFRQSENAASVQFVGTVNESGGIAVGGNGILVGHSCASPAAHEFCGFMAGAQILITTSTRENFDGQLTAMGSGSTAIWPFELGWWPDNLYLERATTEAIAGSRPERFAEWAKGGEVITTVRDDGALFFQSVATGCVGNGWLKPHGDGEFNVFDASLTVEACATEHAHLNGEFEGLATETTRYSGFYCGFYYDSEDCSALVIWLATRPGAPRPRAVAMRIGTEYVY